MRKAICEHCEVTVDYQASRGFRLKEMLCPQCQTPTLRRAFFKGDRYEVESRRRPAKGERVQCGVCGTCRYSRGGNVLTLTRPSRFVSTRWPGRVFPAGTHFCWHHRIDEAVYPVKDGIEGRGIGGVTEGTEIAAAAT